jgi:hypothetical protein
MIYVGHVARMEVEILVGNFKLAMLKDGVTLDTNLFKIDTVNALLCVKLPQNVNVTVLRGFTLCSLVGGCQIT